MKNKNPVKDLKFLITVLILLISFTSSYFVTFASQNHDIATEETGGCEEFECIEISDEEADAFEEKFNIQEQAFYVAGRNWDIYGNDYCRNKMTSVEQEFYDNLDAICRKYINTHIDAEYKDNFGKYYIEGVSYEKLDYNQARDIAFLFTYQNPQYYFLSSALIYNPNKKIIWMRCYDKFADGEARSVETEKFFNKIDAWIAEISLEAYDYDKEKKAYDIVCKNVVYKMGVYDQSAYGAVMEGESVCAGYTKMFGMMMNASGIDTIGITGSGHAWNKVFLYGKWYNVDSTWDDLGNISGYNYFNKSDAQIGSGHVPFSIYEGLLPVADEDYIIIAKVDSSGLYVAEHNNRHILVGMVTSLTHPADVEYRWLAYRTDTGVWSEIQGWKRNNEWLEWKPDLSGEYVLLGQARVIGNEDSVAEASIGIEHHKQIKGKCQMPYTGEGGGYLIGVESYDNPNQSYQYEMLILDCTLLAQDKPAWIYTTGRVRVNEGNALWTIWQPKYGYYWTLFRVYNENGKLIDEECYGFANAY